MHYPSGESIESRVKTLRRLARWASTSIDAWKLLERVINDEASRSSIEQHLPYFVVSCHVHREIGLIYLYSIFENRKDTINVNAVVNHLKRNGINVSDIEHDIKSHYGTLSKLKELRSSAIGHRTSARSYDETFAKIRMTIGELDDLAGLAHRCSIELSHLIRLPEEPSMVNPIDHLADILTTLSESECQKGGLESSSLLTLTDAVLRVSDLYASENEIDRDRDWALLKLQEELGELTAEHLRMTSRARGEPDPQARADEAADVLGMLLIYCAQQGIDLDAAMRRKWLRWLEPAGLP